MPTEYTPGSLYTGQIGYPQMPNSFVRYVDPVLYLRQPYAMPLYQLSQQGMKKEVCTNFKFEWQRDTLRTQFMQLTSGYAANSSGTTTYTDLPDIGFFQVGDNIVNTNTQDVFQVTAINVGTGAISLQTVDGAANSAGVTGDQIQYISTPISQGGLIQQGVDTVPNIPFNYIETFATPFKTDTTTLRSKLYQGEEWTYLHKKKVFEYKWQVETAFLWSTMSSQIGADGNQITTTAGMWNLLTDHVTYARNGFSYSVFDVWLRDHVFQYGKREKVVLMNNKFASDLNGTFFQTVHVNFPEMKDNMTFALKIGRWTSGYGTVAFILMPQAIRTISGTNTNLGMAIAIESELLKARFLQPEFLMENIQNPRALAKEAAIVSQAGVQYTDAGVGSILYES